MLRMRSPHQSGLSNACHKLLLPQAFYDAQQFDLTGQTGSHLYMSPEVFRGEQYNHKADVFSYAIVLYELMHRQLLQVCFLVGCGKSEI